MTKPSYPGHQPRAGVPDGNLYLQKIVQISFCLPRPETFVLRRKFRDAAAALYRKVNGHAPDRIVLEQLTQVADVYGAALKPRGGSDGTECPDLPIPGMRDYVYFPDLCFLQLLRTTNAGLYDWVEEYLSERAVVAAGDGHVSELEQAEMAESLKSHLARYFPAEAHAVHALARWVPGITGWKTDSPIKLFVPTPEQDSALLTAGKRLGSQAYWLYYFAFSAHRMYFHLKCSMRYSTSPDILNNNIGLQNVYSGISRVRLSSEPGLNTF